MGLCGSQEEGGNGPVGGGESKSRVRTDWRPDMFITIRELGMGASCLVRAVKHSQSQQQFALKKMEKSDPNNAALYRNEVDILSLLRHKHVVEYCGAFDDSSNFYILSQLCTGGDLFSKVEESKTFSERVASRMAREMLESLEYCHRQNVVHRDLKPENFVFEDALENSQMKLIDFGCAVRAAPNQKINDVCGSLYYVAPEVLDQSYEGLRTGATWAASDLWSVGVIIYLFVVGSPPFNSRSEDPEAIFRKIRKCTYRWPSRQKVSDSVKDLVAGLLTKDPKRRMTASQALRHPWIIGETAPDDPLPTNVVQNLRSFNEQCRLKKAVAHAMNATMTDRDRQELHAVFRKFDANGDGRLGADEIEAFMKHLGSNMDAKKMMALMDTDGDGTVDIEEFEDANIAGQLSNDEEQIKKAFDMFDKDGDGYVTQDELKQIMKMSGNDIINMVSEVDEDTDGKIDFGEWMKAMSSRRQGSDRKE